MQLKLGAEATRLRRVLEHHFLEGPSAGIQSAHTGVPRVGSRPELAVEAAPMLFSVFGFATLPSPPA